MAISNITLEVPSGRGGMSSDGSRSPSVSPCGVGRRDSFLDEYTDRVMEQKKSRVRTPTLPGMMEMLAETKELRKENAALVEKRIELENKVLKLEAETLKMQDSHLLRVRGRITDMQMEERRSRATLQDAFVSGLLMVLEAHYITVTYRRRSSCGNMKGGRGGDTMEEWSTLFSNDVENVKEEAREAEVVRLQAVHAAELKVLKLLVSKLETKLVQESSKQYRISASHTEARSHISTLEHDLTEARSDFAALCSTHKVTSSELNQLRGIISFQAQAKVQPEERAPPPLFAIRQLQRRPFKPGRKPPNKKHVTSSPPSQEIAISF